MNKSEKAFVEKYKEKYQILRNGYPDFLLIDKKSGDALFVEIKTGSNKLSKGQREMFRALKTYTDIPIGIYRNGILPTLPIA